jgi:hypothetical protein
MKTTAVEKETALVPSTETTAEDTQSAAVVVVDNIDISLADTAKRVDMTSIGSFKITRTIADATYWAPYDNNGLTVEKAIRDLLQQAQDRFDKAKNINDEYVMNEQFEKMQKYRRYVTFLGTAKLPAVFNGVANMVRHVVFLDIITGEMLKAAQKELVSKLTSSVEMPDGSRVQEFAPGINLCITYLGKVTKTMTYNHYEVSKLETPA